MEIEYIENGKLEGPRISKIEEIAKTADSVMIEVTGFRMNPGTYYYYIGTDKDNLGEYVGSNTSDSADFGKYTFTGLTQDTIYYIKVVGQTQNGETTKTIET